MTDGKLAIGELVEGGLALLIAKPIAVAIFILADALMAYSVIWLEARYELGLGVTTGLGIVGYSFISAILILALGECMAEVLADPAELLVRLVFALASALIVSIGAGFAFLLFIVPGLYVLARWAVVSPLILLQGEGIRSALTRSWQLTEKSAWSLVAVSLIIYVPQMLLAFFGGGEIETEWARPTPAFALELIIAAAFTAFEAAVIVFAWRKLSPPPNKLTETFA